MPRRKKRSSKQNHLASLDALWMFSGEWQTLPSLAGIFSTAFGRFLQASCCYIQFLGFARRALDVFRRMTDITSTGKHFLGGFWTFLAGFLVLHPLSWLCGRDLDVFRRMADITSTDKHFLGGFWTFLASFLVLNPLSWLCEAGFGCFQEDDGPYVHWQAFSRRLLDVFR